MAKKVYAIKEGFDSTNNKKVENIVVNTWAECLKYVKGVKGAKYKSFESMVDANEFLYNSNDVLKKEDNNYPMDCLHIYVDGSYNIATKQYSYGLVAMKNNIIEYIDGGIGINDSSRNIRQIAGELDATVRGVEYAKKNHEKKVVIFHDYIGICYHATGFWERKEESSKIYYEKMQNFINSGMEIIFVKVDSHTGDLFNELADEICKEKLRIASDKIVEKWLSSNEIKVVSEEVKEKLSKLITKYSENIIVVGDERKEEAEEESFEVLMKEYAENKDRIMNEISKLSEEKKEEFIEYLLKYTLKK